MPSITWFGGHCYNIIYYSRSPPRIAIQFPQRCTPQRAQVLSKLLTITIISSKIPEVFLKHAFSNAVTFEYVIISCPHNRLRYPALAPFPSPMLGRGVPKGRGEGSYNKSLTGHDITCDRKSQLQTGLDF